MVPKIPEIIDSATTDSNINTNISEQTWYEKVYQGDNVPQLTFRAILMGGILGSIMSISNLYTSIKIGWGFGVAITACVLSFVSWNFFRLIFPKLSQMTILENNCMQSTASAAGYSTGSTIGTAFGALLLITGVHVNFYLMLAWTFLTACLGVFLAVPMKRQMINREQLTFPSGIAAAQTLKSLYAQSKESLNQARSLVIALFAGLGVGFLKLHNFNWLIKLPELILFKLSINNTNYSSFPGFGFEPSVLLIGAGMIIGLRVCVSMFIGSLILYLIFGPYVMGIHEIPGPHKLIGGWALWTGTAIMVTSGLTAFALQWKVIAKSFDFKKNKQNSDQDNLAKINQIEVPTRWLIIGFVPLFIAMTLLEYFAFSISIPLGIVSIVLSAILALVACRATGETDVTPIGAMGKITQLTYAVAAPSNMTTNLMAASVTANIAINSADLLTDLKSGYLLGANPRKQFLAQFIGVFFGTISVVPAWYLMIPNKAALEHFNPPSTLMWKAVAEALAHGINYIPYTARWGLVIGGIIGIVLVLLERYASPKFKKFIPSSMGLGLAWIMPFSNTLAFFIGAMIAFIWSKINHKNADIYNIPIASGLVAGESIMSAMIAIMQSFSGLKHL